MATLPNAATSGGKPAEQQHVQKPRQQLSVFHLSQMTYGNQQLSLSADISGSGAVTKSAMRWARQ